MNGKTLPSFILPRTAARGKTYPETVEGSSGRPINKSGRALRFSKNEPKIFPRNQNYAPSDL
jgi:hypothetical protein